MIMVLSDTYLTSSKGTLLCVHICVSVYKGSILNWHLLERLGIFFKKFEHILVLHTIPSLHRFGVFWV